MGICVKLQAPRKQLTVTMDGPRDSYNMVMTGSPILAIRPIYSYYKLMPFHLTEDNLKYCQ
jgi:hypothetical protein